MKLRYLGVLLAAGSLLFLSACGDDNDYEPPTLAAAITATATSLTVRTVGGLPTTGGVIQIDAEWLGYTARDGNVLSGLIRGVEGTTPAAHALGAVVWLKSTEAPEIPTQTATKPPVTNTPVPPATNTVPVGPSATPTATPEVSATPVEATPTATQGGEAVCGNDSVEPGEQCDDGNLDGGDGCAANCTTEVEAPCEFGCIGAGAEEICSGAGVKTTLFELPLSFAGNQTLTAGQPRDTEVITTDPELTFAADQIPVVLKAADLQVEPVQVPGLVCACVRGEATGQFGPGNAGSGSLGCNADGLADVDYTYEIDHNVTPGSPGNGGGLPDDPGCVNGVPDETHPGVCNSTGVITFTGGGPRGSAVVVSATSISLIQDGGSCAENCGIPDNGPDCIPCTDDDPTREPANALATTTGTATAIVYDANNQAGSKLEAVRTGRDVDCDVVLATPETPDIGGVALVSAFGTVDAPSLGDNATTSVFACVPPAP